MHQEDLERSLHELEIYKEELEAQNEELRAIQQDLAQSRNRYYELYDLAPVAYCTILPDGFISEINLAGAELLGHERGALKTLPFDMFVAQDSLVDYRSFKIKVIQSIVKQTCEVTLMRGDDRIDVQLEGVAVSTTGNEGIRVSMTDITAIKNAHREIARLNESLRRHLRELERSNTDLEQFAYVVSHDLQEPLRMITGFIGLLRNYYEPLFDERGREYMAFVLEGAQRMQRLIHDLLQYARVSSRIEEPGPVDLAEVVEFAVANYSQKIAESGARVITGEMPVLKADRTQLAQVFQNLLANALEYAHPDRAPEIEVRAEKQDHEWTFSVKDNGIGIDAAFFNKIFLIFQRLHRDGPGTGIGLAVCKKIVERHGGRIWVESAPGQGATFFFTLPDWGEIRHE